MSELAELIATASSWIKQDFDAITISELTELIELAKSDKSAQLELATRFNGPLKFGTAGLRAAVGAGESRMNRATVAKAAWGVSNWLLENNRKLLVVGNDARFGSADFANDTCAIAASLGLQVIQISSPIPTPVLAFALTKLNADAAIMVTASHNPAADNGYKVYDHTGSQIINPADVEIAELIATAPAANQIDRNGDYQTIAMIDEYINYVSANAFTNLEDDLKIAYTAMHGVGSLTFNRLLKSCGWQHVFEVTEQQFPDPAFPTVAFPNPEEPGAMDLLLQLAERQEVDIAIANDPDADRTAIAVPTATGWQVLAGDELGSLLAWWCIERAKLQNIQLTGSMAASIVSGSMISRIAKANNLRFESTLTGFKYVSRVQDLIFGYEEAIGYAVLPEQIKDKDGISAGLFAIELAAYLKSKNLTLLDQLDLLYRQLGSVLTKQITLRLASVTAVMQKMQDVKKNIPKQLGNVTLTEVADFANGVDGLPKSSGIRLSFANGRIIIRPSGTEPKLKCYIEVSGAPTTDLAQQQAVLKAQLEQLTKSLSELFEN